MDIEEGSMVEVKDPDAFISAVKAKITNRVGIVERVFTPLGQISCWARVRFLKRGGRGKEFEEIFAVRDLQLSEQQAQREGVEGWIGKRYTTN
jgi:hypothetical protein